MQREHSKSALSKSCDGTCLSREKVGRVSDEVAMSGNEASGEKQKKKFVPPATEILVKYNIFSSTIFV